MLAVETVQSERVAWAEDLGRMGRWPLVTNLLISLVAWEMAEGGGFGNVAQYNPLNTSLRVPGSFDIGEDLGNGEFVQGYPTEAAGLSATYDTLTNGDYPELVTALSQGYKPAFVAATIGASPWGTIGSVVSGCILGAARAVADFYQVPGEPKMFIQTNAGDVFEEVVVGGDTIWRGVDANCLPSLPTAWIVPDPLGHWLNRFKVEPAAAE